MGNKYSGVYQFTFPYLPYPRQQDPNGFHEIKKITAEIHVGREEDLIEGKWITLIAYSTTSFSDYVETIFSNLRSSFLTDILHVQPKEGIFAEDAIRLVEVHTKSQDIHDWHEIEMNWDDRLCRYSHPVWKAISPEAWYFQFYQSKIKQYAQMGLQYLNSHHLSPLQTPLWLIKAFQDTGKWLQKEQIEANSLSLMISSLRRLAKLDTEYLSYSSEITTLIIQEMNQLQWSDNADKYYMLDENRQLFGSYSP